MNENEKNPVVGTSISFSSNGRETKAQTSEVKISDLSETESKLLLTEAMCEITELRVALDKKNKEIARLKRRLDESRDLATTEDKMPPGSAVNITAQVAQAIREGRLVSIKIETNQDPTLPVQEHLDRD